MIRARPWLRRFSMPGLLCATAMAMGLAVQAQPASKPAAAPAGKAAVVLGGRTRACSRYFQGSWKNTP